MIPIGAHSSSLYIYTAIQRIEEEGPCNAIDGLVKTISYLHLEKDVQPIIIITESTSISVEPLSPLGAQILSELQARYGAERE